MGRRCVRYLFHLPGQETSIGSRSRHSGRYGGGRAGLYVCILVIFRGFLICLLTVLTINPSIGRLEPFKAGSQALSAQGITKGCLFFVMQLALIHGLLRHQVVNRLITVMQRRKELRHGIQRRGGMYMLRNLRPPPYPCVCRSAPSCGRHKGLVDLCRIQ